MKKIETLFTGIGLVAIIIVAVGQLWKPDASNLENPIKYTTNKYGAFLVSQHAIAANDFDTASKYAEQIPDSDLKIIKETSVLTGFLSGNLSDNNVKSLKNETDLAAQFVYNTYLIRNNDWKSVYKIHKKDKSTITAPLHIWSGIAINYRTKTLKFIKTLNSNDSWKHFIRGSIYAEIGNIKKASAEFEKVNTSFININDYLYLTAFYNEHKMNKAAEKLHHEFTSSAGGMFMMNMKVSPKWSDYKGYNNQLAFSLIQTVSHTKVMMYSDLSLLMLRFAEKIQDNKDDEILKYYIGSYFFTNGGDYNKYFDKINKSSPLYPFAQMKIVEKTNNIKALEAAVNANPLFTPAVTKLVARKVQNGEKRAALKIVNKALKDTDLTKSGKTFFIKTRAGIYLTFGELDAAQKDIEQASDINPTDSDILAIQSKIWTMQKRELNTAYNYALALVRKNPTNIEYWDILGMIVLQTEGPDAALDVLEKVGEVAVNCSSLFEHLGDIYTQVGNKKLAYESYTRAIALSDDGLTVMPKLERKLRNLK